MENRSIELSLQEAQLVFKSLAELPFKLVYELIGKINKQSNSLIITGGKSNQNIRIELTNQEFNRIVKALEKQPFTTVHKLIEKLNSQCKEVS